MTTAQLKEQLKKLPNKPGVYLFKNSEKILYIGKALSLKNRVSNYLKAEDSRLKKMISEATKIDFIETKNDIEALILESQYIKKNRPDFNIMLRDDKQYFYVGLTNDLYPKVFLTHQPQNAERNQIEFIGPFTDGSALKTTLRLLRRIFPYCTCKQSHNNYCLNYHIGKCIGDCCLKKTETDNLKRLTYKKNIKAIKDLLSGKKSSLIKDLQKEMRELSSKEEYEKAIVLQEKIEKIKRIFENALIIRDAKESSNVLKELAEVVGIERTITRIEAYDIANIQGTYAVGAMVVFTNGKPDKNEYRKFKIYTKNSPDDTGMLREVLIRRFKHPEWASPDLVIIDGGKGQLNSARSITHPDIPVISIAKNEKHLGYKMLLMNNEISLTKLSINLKNLLLQIDSEAHRFAISYYRHLHKKSVK